MTNRFGDIDVSFQRLPPVYGYHAEKIVPLEKALEPIVPQIHELPRFIKIAKKYCHFPSEHGLLRDQSAAVYIYTMEWGDTTLYRVLNNALRSANRQALKIWFPYLKLLDSALDKLPTIKEILWRGVPLDIGKKFIKNQVFTWWSVSSCSLSVDVIKSFLGDNENSTLFLIEAINGKKVSDYTEYEDEDEIILRIGTQFRVKSNALEQSNGSHIVHLVEIDDDDDEPLTSGINEMQLSLTSSKKSASDFETKKTPEASGAAALPKAGNTKSSSTYVVKESATKMMETPKHKTRTEDQEFAPPGKYKELGCKGRHCTNCGRCRDWYFTGDMATWRWIQDWNNWRSKDWEHYGNDKIYERFQKRDGATCIRRRCLYYYRSRFSRDYRDRYCLCDDNIIN